MSSHARDEYYSFAQQGSTIRLQLGSNVSISRGKEFNDFLLHLKKQLKNADELVVDLNLIEKYDSLLALLCKQASDICKEKEKKFGIESRNQELIEFVDALAFNKKNELEKKPRPLFIVEYISRVGSAVLNSAKDLYDFIEFFGDLSLKLLTLPIKFREIRWKDFPLQFVKAGVNAFPIVVLIVFLIGLITGYQGAVQLKQFGADIYLADLIGISITRELSPLMTAILVAGRSGSAFAAELGTMKVSEEIDALNSMGFDHMSFLVVPRVLSVTLSMPILVLISDFFGIFGGLLAGLATLDITITGFLNQLQNALVIEDILSGLIKAAVFGLFISAIGCYRGLQVRGGAISVGKYTTLSVVTAVFVIIFSDAIFTFVFQALGF
jgi:phospholipid/cholesterol/gamma-HCH transport system permease protein